ncbi:hypothetical protein BC834DRAFT_848337 [Gloeopeniophorella convolvens]|nr:hypothetical protein BC834DRAFT_848337 [Gloeopeniophorella convolvens]
MKSLEISINGSVKSPTPVPEPDEDEPEPEQWLELLQPFNIVEELWLKDSSASSGFCQTLGTLTSGGEEALIVLPALRGVVLGAESEEQGSALAQALDLFVEARRLADRPVTVTHHTRPPLLDTRSG